MTSPAAAGERFVAAAGDVMSFHDIAVLLKERMGEDGARVPSTVLPDSAAPGAVSNLGKIRHTSSAKARRMLGWSPRSNEEAVLSTARSLLRISRG
jgi:dihydroflavonol-4-reductase